MENAFLAGVVSIESYIFYQYEGGFFGMQALAVFKGHAFAPCFFGENSASYAVRAYMHNAARNSACTDV